MQLRELLQQIEEGRYAIPEIQRPFVWRNRQVLGLFESIYKKIPIGTLLVWDMPRQFIEDYNDLLRPLTDNLEPKRLNFRYMVLDGQQRLVSIYLAKQESIEVQGEQRHISLYYDATSDELKLGHKKDFEEEPSYFRIPDILTKEVYDILAEKAKVMGVDESQLTSNTVTRKRLSTLRETLLTYDVNVLPISEYVLPYNSDEDNFQQILDTISEIFIRLNSQGTRVKMPDLVAAVLTSKTRGEIGQSFKAKIRELTQHFEERGWVLDESVLMRIYMIVATGTTKFREAKDMLKSKRGDEILQELEKVKSLLNRCANVLEQLNVRSLDYLKSKYSLVTLCTYLSTKPELGVADITSIARWLLLSSFDRRYTGRLESDLYEDVTLVLREKSLKALEGKLRIKEITDSLLDTEFDREHRLALQMILKDAFDLRKDKLIRISELKPADIEEHHIFPKDVLRKVFGREIAGRTNDREVRLDIEEAYNSAANMTLISKEANGNIGSRRPDEYLQWFDQETLKQHCIPINQDLWKPENYLNFLEERKRMLLNRLRTLLGE
jgi:hypothetical protein